MFGRVFGDVRSGEAMQGRVIVLIGRVQVHVPGRIVLHGRGLLLRYMVCIVSACERVVYKVVQELLLLLILLLGVQG